MHVLNRGLFVTCEPVERIEEVQEGLIDERLAEVGTVYLVCDMQKEIQGKAKLIDAFVTTYGDPDPKLLEYMGFKDNASKFHKEYAGLFKKLFPEEPLIDETELFVTAYEPVVDS
jgi:uncharacterized protein YhfF